MQHFGWLNRPEQVDAYLATLAAPTFAQAGAHLFAADDGGDRFFWQPELKVCGKNFDAWDQGQIGSCVSHGSGRAAQDVLIVQIALGAAEAWHGPQVAREPIYGGSRCEIGGEYGSRSDGSVGAWAAQWLNKYGIVFYEKYDTVDLSDGYSVSRCKQWGASGAKPVEGYAKQHPVQDTAQINTGADAWASLGNWNPISICGSISRTMKRQKNGFCPKTGNDWPHCQALRGRCTVKGGIKSVVYCNSWGGYLGSDNAEVELENGATIYLPAGHYLSELSEIESDLRQGDTFAYSHAVGFPGNPPNLGWDI